jgi:anti-sigma-K factor RskA
MTLEREGAVTAAELALGVLDGEEKAAAMRRVLADPEFAREVERWRTHFNEMLAEVDAVEPPDGMFARIETALWPQRSSRLLWPAIAAALAASLILALVMRPAATTPPTAPAHTLVAALDPATKGASIPAVYDPSRGVIKIAAIGQIEPGRSNELWLIGDDGAPHSLGLLKTNAGSTVSVSEANRSAMVAGTKLAISSEPAGGSPSGQPTGPIMATGAFTSL